MIFLGIFMIYNFIEYLFFFLNQYRFSYLRLKML